VSSVLANLACDRDAWAASELRGGEDYPGEARERREANELAIDLLGGE
jgi:hypothetical protein